MARARKAVLESLAPLYRPFYPVTVMMHCTCRRACWDPCGCGSDVVPQSLSASQLVVLLHLINNSKFAQIGRQQRGRLLLGRGVIEMRDKRLRLLKTYVVCTSAHPDIQTVDRPSSDIPDVISCG